MPIDPQPGWPWTPRPRLPAGAFETEVSTKKERALPQSHKERQENAKVW